MIHNKRRARRQEAERVRAALREMLLDPTNASEARFVGDMLFYAEVGMDRDKLTMAYVEEVRGHVEEFKQMRQSLAELATVELRGHGRDHHGVLAPRRARGVGPDPCPVSEDAS